MAAHPKWRLRKKIIATGMALIMGLGTTAGLAAQSSTVRAPLGAPAAGPLYSPGGTADLFYNPRAQGALAAAKSIQQSIDKDYQILSSGKWFGIQIPPMDWSNLVPNLPLTVYVTKGVDGAYHYGCASTNYVLENEKDIAPGLAVAELTESFEAAIGNGWDCGHTNGEALSRVASYILHPALAADSGWSWPQFSWWQDGHKDFVNTNAAGDKNFDADGCGVLFLYYLRDQLGFTMNQIIQAGGKTLGQTYERLMASRGILETGKQGFQNFVLTLAKISDQLGNLNLPSDGNPNGSNPAVPYNPFPIAA